MEAPPSEEFSITAPPGEQATLRVNVEGLRELSEQSRGRFYLEADAERLFDELPLASPLAWAHSLTTHLELLVGRPAIRHPGFPGNGSCVVAVKWRVAGR